MVSRLVDGKHQRTFDYRALVEGILGRPLKQSEVVHHIDGNPLNNDHSNLVVMEDNMHRHLHCAMEKAENT